MASKASWWTLRGSTIKVHAAERPNIFFTLIKYSQVTRIQTSLFVYSMALDLDDLLYKSHTCGICLEDIPPTKHAGGFACSKIHYFHPACIFQSLVVSGKPPSCPLCEAEPTISITTLQPFRSLVSIPSQATRDAHPKLLADFYLQDQDYLTSFVRKEPPGFLVATPYPFTRQDFGHFSNTTTHGKIDDMEVYPLAVVRCVPEGLFGRKMIGYGTLIYFRGKAYRLEEDVDL
jgi:hypothetical protein